jgi:hypothetical protein
VPSPWSIDARVLVRPNRELQSLASAVPQTRSSLWIALRRPLFLTFVLACAVSLIATSVATFRLIGATAVWWTFVAIAEIIALAAVTWQRRGSRSFAALTDIFFTGHAAWTLLILLVAAMLAFAPPQYWRLIIVGPTVVGILVVVAWSAYVDVCFFRHVCGATLGRAIAQVAVQRFIAWTLILWIFCAPTATPFGVYGVLGQALAEVLR